MGISFRAYLLRVRLERAKHLLAHRRASITEVAQAVGFGDLPRFDKLFKRDTGVTPSTYRSRRRRDHSESVDVVRRALVTSSSARPDPDGRLEQ
jgi:AraC-like DNA-binding protein